MLVLVFWLGSKAGRTASVNTKIAEVIPPAKSAEAPAPAPIPSVKAAPVVDAQPPQDPATAALDRMQLQAVFFSSQHPSAMISGQLAFVNQEVGQCRVLEISPSSVTLQCQNKRKTLTLR